MRILDRMIKWVSIAIVVVGGVFVVTLVPYLKGDVTPRARVVQTVSPASTGQPEAATPAPTPSVPSVTPAPPDEAAQATPADEAPSGAQTLSAGALEKAAGPDSDGSGPAPTPTVSLLLGLPDEEGLPEGLVLAPMSPFAQDYELRSLIYPEGGMRMPALIQHDYKTPVATIGDRDISVWTSGCGADAISMVVAYFTGDTRQTPYTLFRWATEHGLYKGSGLEHEALTSLAALYGIRGRWIEPDADAILEALNAGQPVIAHMGRGFFTNSGHYVVLRGVAPDGTIYVNDPAVLENCFLTYPLDQIIKESKSDDPFMICAGPSA